MNEIIYQWIDLFWIPIALLVVPKRLKIKTVLFILGCAFSLRTQVELIEMIGSPTGLLNIMQSDVFFRGVIVYGVFTALFLLIAFLSPRSRAPIFIAAAISIYLLAFCSSMVIMAL